MILFFLFSTIESQILYSVGIFPSYQTPFASFTSIDFVMAIFNPNVTYQFDAIGNLGGLIVQININMPVNIGDSLVLNFPNLEGPGNLGPNASAGLHIALLYFLSYM